MIDGPGIIQCLCNVCNWAIVIGGGALIVIFIAAIVSIFAKAINSVRDWINKEE